MRYDQIESLLLGGATKTERINMLASETQSKIDGIIDGTSGTDCDSNYWQRDYGNYDALAALYDALAGRDTTGSMNILGALVVNNSIVASVAPLYAATLNTSAGDVTSFANLVGINAILQSGAGDLRTGSVHLDGEIGGTQGLFYKELYHATPLNEENKFLYFEDGDMIFLFPHTDAEYGSWAEQGGSWHFKQGDGRFAASLNQRGALHLGGETDDPTDPVQIIMSKLDAAGGAGATKILSQTTAADDRTTSSLLIEEVLKHTTNPEKSLGIKLDIGATSKWDFLYNDASVANLSEGGVLTVNGITVLNSGAIVGSNSPLVVGTVLASGAITGTSLTVGLGTIACGEASVSGNLIASGFLSLGDATQTNPWMRAYATTLDQYFEMEDANGYNFAFGLLDAATNGDAVLYGNFNKLSCQAGATYGTPSGEFWLELLSSGSSTGGILFTSSQETFALFVDSVGVAKTYEVGAFPVGVGSQTTGYHKIPDLMITAFDGSDQSTINTQAAGVSDKARGAILAFEDLADGYNFAVCNGVSGDWAPLGGLARGHVSVNAATATIGQGTKKVSVPYTATGSVTLTIDSDLASEGYELVIKDTGGDAQNSNITIQTEGAELIEGESSLIIANNRAAVSLYCDGTNWHIF